MVAAEEKKKDFEKQVKELLKFFEHDYEYPESFCVKHGETIIDPRLFIENAVQVLQVKWSNIHYRSHLETLILVRQYVVDNKLKKLGARVYEHKVVQKTEQAKRNISQGGDRSNIQHQKPEYRCDKPDIKDTVKRDGKTKQQSNKKKQSSSTLF